MPSTSRTPATMLSSVYVYLPLASEATPPSFTQETDLPPPLVPLPPRTISAKLHPYGRAAGVRLGVGLCRFWNGVVWLEDRFRKIQTGRVDWCYIVRQTSRSDDASSDVVNDLPSLHNFQVCYFEPRADTLCVFHRAGCRVPGEAQNLR